MVGRVVPPAPGGPARESRADITHILTNVATRTPACEPRHPRSTPQTPDPRPHALFPISYFPSLLSGESRRPRRAPPTTGRTPDRSRRTPGQPEQRTYRAIYVGPGDEEVGDPGNELTVTARP